MLCERNGKMKADAQFVTEKREPSEPLLFPFSQRIKVLIIFKSRFPLCPLYRPTSSTAYNDFEAVVIALKTSHNGRQLSALIGYHDGALLLMDNFKFWSSDCQLHNLWKRGREADVILFLELFDSAQQAEKAVDSLDKTK